MSILKQHSHDGIAPGRPSHAHHGQPAGHPPGGVFAEGSGGGGAHHTHHAHMVADFRRRFSEALRPGAYLRIVVEGDVGAGDEIRIVEKPNHDLTIRDVFRIYTRDRAEVERLLTVPQMSDSWRRWAADLLHKPLAAPRIRPNPDVAESCS